MPRLEFKGTEDLRFSQEAVEELDRLVKAYREALLAHAMELATAEGETRVTEDHVNRAMAESKMR